MRADGLSGSLLCCLLLASILLTLPGSAQLTSKLTPKGSRLLGEQSAQSGIGDAEDSTGRSPSMDSWHREMKEKQTRELRKQRYAQVVSNTEELLRLATELNAEVSASGTGSLTAGQLRTLARIEKLARNVKEGMVRPVPAEQTPASTPVIALP
jgi:hypothetical protein